MTKERRLAIQMWEYIYNHPDEDIDDCKVQFCRDNELKWQHRCWFCQYVRKDYRGNLKSRQDVDPAENRCEQCPLYKWYDSIHGFSVKDACGCDCYGERTLFTQAALQHDKEAIGLIVKALKGEKIWKK